MARGRFRGEDHLKMDSKGRVSIPAKWRRILQDGEEGLDDGAAPTMVVVYGDHLDGCLECYSLAGMEEIEDLIEGLELGSPERDALEQGYLSQSTDVTLDDTGRAVLPARLRDKLGLSGDNPQVYVRGLGQSFEIWNPEAFQTQKSSSVREWMNEQGKGYSLKHALNDARRGRAASQ